MSDITTARLDEKAARVFATVKKLLGEHYTPEEFIRALLFEAAWARILLEDQQRLLEQWSRQLEESGRIMVELNAWARELGAELTKTGAAHVTDLREKSAHLDALHAQWMEIAKQARPLVEKGHAWVQTQRNNSFMRWEDEQKKHEKWRRWQAAEIEADLKFRTYSKMEQARRLKKDHSIPDEVETIAKRLS